MIRYTISKMCKISGIYLVGVTTPILLAYLFIKTDITSIGVNISGIIGCLFCLAYGILLIFVADKSKKKHEQIIKLTKDLKEISVSEIAKKINMPEKRTKIAIYELKTSNKISYWSKVTD